MGARSTALRRPQRTARRLLRRFIPPAQREGAGPASCSIDAHWIDRRATSSCERSWRPCATPGRCSRQLPSGLPAGVDRRLQYHQLALAPLGEAASRELLSRAARLRPLAGRARRAHSRAHRRNPYFTRSGAGAGGFRKLVGERGDYHLGAAIVARPSRDGAVPLAARLDDSASRRSTCLQAAAVMACSRRTTPRRGVRPRRARPGCGARRAAGRRFVGLLTAAQRPSTHSSILDARRGIPLAARRAESPAARSGGRAPGAASRGSAGEHAALIAHHWRRRACASGGALEAACRPASANIKLGGRADGPRRNYRGVRRDDLAAAGTLLHDL